MKVIVEVTGGKSKGKKFDLTQSPTDDAHYILCEDDVLVFSILTKELIPTIHLALHEVFMPPTDGPYPPTEFSPYYEYRWEPRKIRNSERLNESFFHNFCGLAELIVVDRVQTSYDSYEIEILKQLQPIEVLARKINADRINGMLDFLARNEGRDLAALARITRKHSGFKEGDKTIVFTLDRIEKYLSFLEESLPKIIRKPIIKIVSRNTVRPYSRHSNITEDSINHIISSPESIYEVSSDDALFKFNDRFFALDTILEAEVVEETDLYENQVLHGFIEVLLIATNDILKKLGEIKLKRNSNILGYESLFNKLNQFNARLNQPCIDRCVSYIRQFSKIKHILANHVKVKKIITSEPHFTHKAKQNLTYHQVFLMMIEWSRFGTPDWSLQNELNSIQDLSKLFEFYVFCVTKEHVLNCSLQYHGGLIESPIDGTNDSRFVFQINQQIRAELLYEPNIFCNANQDDDLLPLYINTEAWKNKSDSRNLSKEYDSYNLIRKKHGFLLRVDGARVQKMYRMRRTPDIVLRLINDDQESLLMMDAKYMTTHKAFHFAMPECTMKYLHGIHVGATGKNNSIGLMIVNPDEDDLTIHYHRNEYSIFGNHPVTPAMMTAAIDVANSHNLGSTIQKNIFRLMELMALTISEKGLGEIKTSPIDLYNLELNSSKLELKFAKLDENKIMPLEQEKIGITGNSSINYETKSNRKIRSGVDQSKSVFIGSRSKKDLPIGPLFNLKQSDYEKKQLESQTSKNFEKLRQQY